MNNLNNVLTGLFGKIGFKIKRYAPEILLGVGVGLGATGLVAGCIASTKVKPVIEEAKYELDKINDKVEGAIIDEGETDYTHEDAVRDRKRIKFKTGLKLAKLYGPTLICELGSLGCILSAHGVLRNREASLAAAYAALDRGFKSYRKRVEEKVGAEKAQGILYDVKETTVEETDENGKKKKVKKTYMNAPHYDAFSRTWEPGCDGWEPDPELSKQKLLLKQSFLNDRLRIIGHLTINEVYRELDLPETRLGQRFGWIAKSNDKGDNFVDFGLGKPQAAKFINGYENCVMLNFNCYDILSSFEEDK